MKKLILALCTASTFYGAPATHNFFTEQDLRMPVPHYELPPPKNPTLAASLSFLFPGLGHAYLGDLKTAGNFLSSVSAGIGTRIVSQNDTVQLSSLATVQSVWFYGVYAAFRDARIQNGVNLYSYQMPVDSLSDLITAPIRPSIMKKPAVWGGILGAFALAAGMSYFVYADGDAHIAPKLSSFSSTKIFPLVALPVGVSEEALFRGYLQTQLAEATNPVWGVALSSLIFGAAHISNASGLKYEDRWRYYSFSVPFISAFGAYFGWLTSQTHSLKEAVAIHTWYDFILFTGDYVANRAAGMGTSSRFSISFPF